MAISREAMLRGKNAITMLKIVELAIRQRCLNHVSVNQKEIKLLRQPLSMNI